MRRWQIVDIPIAQQLLTTLKKENQKTPKGTKEVITSKTSLNLQIEKQLTLGRMGTSSH
jgi:hypothetical protein